MKRYDVYRQDVFDDERDPGEGWEPFAASCQVCYMRESLGGAYVEAEVIWWRRCVETKEEATKGVPFDEELK